MINTNVKQADIPANTTPRHYITGIHALNLQAPEGTSGDWHHYSTFYGFADDETFHLQLAGEGEFLNTYHIYGTYGIYECSAGMRKVGLRIPENITAVYAANHFRAILDLLYESLIRNGKVIGLIGATEDFLDTQEQKEFLLEKATEMIPFLSKIEAVELQKWIDKERPPGYRS